uniref:Uncharacterized protein n=1 Tax=Chromera velia CCMP2878 TaxID=1169474 RepID=A0A0G4HIN6_9ALVE|eukprot:Cvel_27861.t1-p1 / transcript=Cvel_27861.t1 / gene=Cvel_27861 / organism=Chromera_velia_CCMP2878 / gene_product=hypothetical protein / transcript_product=hypothetical protein / location=Cvel_scaffold3544:4953-5549(+) / protein_length=199 / sequence_SO=supercontig / SO=protein_coding / is_pseudo=false
MTSGEDSGGIRSDGLPLWLRFDVCLASSGWSTVFVLAGLFALFLLRQTEYSLVFRLRRLFFGKGQAATCPQSEEDLLSTRVQAGDGKKTGVSSNKGRSKKRPTAKPRQQSETEREPGISSYETPPPAAKSHTMYVHYGPDDKGRPNWDTFGHSPWEKRQGQQTNRRKIVSSKEDDYYLEKVGGVWQKRTKDRVLEKQQR